MIINNIIIFLSILFIESNLIFPRAYPYLKLINLIFLLIFILCKNNFKIDKNILFFFIQISLINLFGVFVGLVYNNNFEFIWDGIRLGIIFQLIIAVLWSGLLSFNYKIFLTIAIKTALGVIFIISVISVIQEYTEVQFFSDSFIKENGIRAGIRNGFVQLTAGSIGSLFFISGYLIYYYFYSYQIKFYDKIVLVLLLATVFLSGRRALEFIVILSPLLLKFNNFLFNVNNNKVLFYYFKILFPFFLVIIVIMYHFDILYLDDIYNRFISAFSGVDDRHSQIFILLNGFINFPIFGSGIGGVLDYEGRGPTNNFELSYLQILFNFGIFGCILYAIVFFIQLYNIRLKSKNYIYSIEDKSLLNGVLFLIIGSFTNPYLSSFDFLFFLGAIPFINSIHNND